MMDFQNTRPTTPVASLFYPHPYGGIARDTWVSKEGFCRFFELSEEDVVGMPVNCKWMDVSAGATTECLGYKMRDRSGRRWINGEWSYDPELICSYKITIIEFGHSRITQIVQMAPYLMKGHRLEVQDSVN